jgi:hypothetical protein
MTVYCDDSGWGSLLGGVAIGLYNDENRKFLYQILPVRLFQGKEFIKQTYLDEALDSFTTMESRIGVYKKIVICRGFILDHIWEFLQEHSSGRRLARAEIGDPLQSMLENAFAVSLNDIGVISKSSGAHCLSFDDQIKWIKKDPTRVKYVKTGWPSWKKHSKKHRIKV